MKSWNAVRDILGKSLRDGSWVVSALVVLVLHDHHSLFRALVAGLVAWLVLQIAAILVESFTINE